MTEDEIADEVLDLSQRFVKESAGHAMHIFVQALSFTMAKIIVLHCETPAEAERWKGELAYILAGQIEGLMAAKTGR
jgi:hypothetical protein